MIVLFSLLFAVFLISCTPYMIAGNPYLQEHASGLITYTHDNPFIIELITATLITLSLICILYFHFSIKKNQDVLAQNTEQLNVAVKKTGIMIWTYDITRNAIINSRNSTLMSESETIENIPQGLFDRGLIDPSSYDNATQFYHAAAEGQPEGSTVLKTYLQNKHDASLVEPHWMQIFFTTIFDKEEKPVRAICLSKDITEQYDTSLRYRKVLKYQESMTQDAIAKFEIDATTGDIINVKKELLQKYGLNPAASLSEMVETIAETALHPSDRERCALTFNPAHLIDEYTNGNRTVLCEARYNKRMDPETSPAGHLYVWIGIFIQLILDEQTQHIYGHVYVKIIDQQKRATLALERRAKYDGTTGLLNKESAQEETERFLENEDGQGFHALIMIDLDNFKDINDRYGHLAGDRILRTVGRVLGKSFRADDIVSRFGGDEFTVFVKNITRTTVVERIAYFNRLLKNEQQDTAIKARCSIGVAFTEINKSRHYLDLLKRADDAMYTSKEAGGNNFTFACHQVDDH